jgi:drug/metabolite transporter (DMT)-like permease
MPSRDRDRATDAMVTPAGHAKSAGPQASSAALVPHLVVLVCVAAGIYIAWHQGSHGGGRGGVVAGVALLVAAAVRLAVPTRLAGLLAVRHRATDVVTLVVLGVSLLAVGLVLPGLWVAHRTGSALRPRGGRRWSADEREMMECLRSR